MKKTADKERGYHFVLELWVETTSYDVNDVLSKLDDVFERYAYCLHDKDVNENGELKKAHYHIYGKRKNQTKREVLASKLGIPLNHCYYSTNWRGAVRYLIHVDDPDKYQYLVEEVISNFDVLPYIDSQTEQRRVSALIEFILSNPNVTVYELSLYAMTINAWSEFRRCYSILKDIMKERGK